MLTLKKTHKAFNTNVIVRETDSGDERTTRGGIILDQYEMGRAEGIIEDIGPNSFEDFGDRKPVIGTKIVYARYAGKELGIYEDGVTRRIMRDLDVLCEIIEEGAK